MAQVTKVQGFSADGEPSPGAQTWWEGVQNELNLQGTVEMRGTGMPEGTVTASPGTYYTDTTGTNGAWRWIKKTGTGNTGWKVVHGDTGWRGVNPYFVNDAAPGGACLMRRSNEMVQLTLEFTLPSGFQAGNPVVKIPNARMFQPAGGYLSPGYAGAPGYVFSSDGEDLCVNVYLNGPNDGLRFTWTYLALHDDWPTILP